MRQSDSGGYLYTYIYIYIIYYIHKYNLLPQLQYLQVKQRRGKNQNNNNNNISGYNSLAATMSYAPSGCQKCWKILRYQATAPYIQERARVHTSPWGDHCSTCKPQYHTARHNTPHHTTLQDATSRRKTPRCNAPYHNTHPVRHTTTLTVYG